MVQSVVVDCDVKSICSEYENKFSFLVSEKADPEILRDRIRFALIDPSIRSFRYSLVKEENHFVIKIEIGVKRSVRTISLEIPPDEGNIRKLLSQIEIKSGDFVGPTELQNEKKRIEEFLFDNGVVGPEVSILSLEDGNSVDLTLQIKFKGYLRIRSINAEVGDRKLNKELVGFLSELKQAPWEKGAVLSELNRFISSKKREGHYFISIKVEEKVDKNQQVVDLSFIGKLGPRVTFYMEGNRAISRSKIKEVIDAQVSSEQGKIVPKTIAEIVNKLYQSKGRMKAVTEIRKQEGFDQTGQAVENYIISIKEGEKTVIRSLRFYGVTKLDYAEVENDFYSSGGDLVKSGHYDQKYIEDYRDRLLERYHRDGFLFAQVNPPVISFEGDNVDIYYRVSEKFQTEVSQVNFNFIPDTMKEWCRANATNKAGRPINVIELEKDLLSCLNYVRSQGLFFARIESKDILRYHNGNREVEINVNFSPGKMARFDSLLVTGYQKTKYEIFKREIELKSGDLVTPEAIEKIATTLNSLGLFGQVKITPYIQDRSDPGFDRVNLLVQVREKAFGQGEFAPGYRTDLGAKAAMTIVWNNIRGMNKSLSLKIQGNQRFSFRGLDERRSREQNKILEFATKVQFVEPYFLYDIIKTKLLWQTSVSGKRKRFRSYDADIVELSSGISKRFFSFLTLGIDYQLELIRPFDATEDKDKDDARIGSLNPSISLDFRDNPLAPTKGAYFSLGLEYASPAFYSLKDDRQVIKYYKAVSRNKFYFPMGPFVMATSWSLGVEKNLAQETRYDSNGNPVYNQDEQAYETVGFIPSIKVFSLSGVDQVRGFADDEINRLEGGQDVDEVAVRNTAYFSNIKIEPRYYFEDSLAVGWFLDMGRIFVNHFKPIDLRMATGIGFKYLTPVGSLDFSYGVKLHREVDLNGRRESFGRIHLTIGDF